jgi:dihydrofolate reductase
VERDVRKLIYSMTVSLDGFIAGPDGEIDWSAPDDELHRFHNDQVRELGVHLCGRRLYETMVYWETAAEDPSLSQVALEFAPIWKALPKIVFSSSLTAVEGNARLTTQSPADEVQALKRQPGKDLAVGGAGLASSLIERGLIDDFRLFVSPVLLGAGTPYFPASTRRTHLRLLETRTFSSRVVYLRYMREQQEAQTR